MNAPFRLNERTGRYHAERPFTEAEIIETAKAIAVNWLLRVSDALSSPQQVREFLLLHLADLEHEVFACLFLDTRHRVIAFEQLFRGTIDGASVHPREVVKTALGHNAAAVILAHNHPSGVAEPSRADEAITRRLKAALELVDIRMLDHLVVGGDCAVSFAERGLI